MQFLVTLSVDQLTSSPADLQAAMTEFVESERKSGTFLVTGGLGPRSDGARVALSSSGLLNGDASLPIHGFAVVDADSLADAVDVAGRILGRHQEHVPDLGGNCEIRPVVTHCLP
jgi:hypothetical protein